MTLWKQRGEIYVVLWSPWHPCYFRMIEGSPTGNGVCVFLCVYEDEERTYTYRWGKGSLFFSFHLEMDLPHYRWREVTRSILNPNTHANTQHRLALWSCVVGFSRLKDGRGRQEENERHTEDNNNWGVRRFLLSLRVKLHRHSGQLTCMVFYNWPFLSTFFCQNQKSKTQKATTDILYVMIRLIPLVP